MTTDVADEPPVLGKDFDQFMDALREPEAGVAALSPKRFSQILGIDLQTLAAQARVIAIPSAGRPAPTLSSSSCAKRCA